MRGENAAQDALCLGDKFMKLADKILEDEPYASAQSNQSVREMRERQRHHCAKTRMRTA